MLSNVFTFTNIDFFISSSDKSVHIKILSNSYFSRASAVRPIMDLSYKSYYNKDGKYISIPEFYDGKSVFITEGT